MFSSYQRYPEDRMRDHPRARATWWDAVLEDHGQQGTRHRRAALGPEVGTVQGVIGGPIPSTGEVLAEQAAVSRHPDVRWWRQEGDGHQRRVPTTAPTATAAALFQPPDYCDKPWRHQTVATSAQTGQLVRERHHSHSYAGMCPSRSPAACRKSTEQRSHWMRFPLLRPTWGR